MEYIIGTRGSKLALAQAGYVCKRLTEAYPKDRFQLQVIKTKGDLILDKPLHEIGEKGLFVNEIESQLLSGNIHIGVHSMKDMPASPAPGLMFSKAWEREDSIRYFIHDGRRKSSNGRLENEFTRLWNYLCNRRAHYFYDAKIR